MSSDGTRTDNRLTVALNTLSEACARHVRVSSVAPQLFNVGVGGYRALGAVRALTPVVNKVLRFVRDSEDRDPAGSNNRELWQPRPPMPPARLL